MHRQALRLDLTWKQVAERAGMTEYHLQRIRSGKTALTERAAAKIDRAMEWDEGSARRIYDEGGEPAPLRREHSPPGTPPIPPGLPVDPGDWAAMTPQERTDYVRILTGVRRRRDQQRRGA